jgi:tRNA dimethylallyltransferase
VHPAVAIFGPTASGKSALALELAARLDAEIVSCDAMQVYRGLPILTNQPTADQLAAVPHHLVGVWPLEHAGSVAEFGRLAHTAVDDVTNRGRRVVLVGGSGLYMRAAVADLKPQPQPDAGDRERFSALYDRDPHAAYTRLQEVDPVAAGAVHANDRRRVVRGLELHAAGASLAPDHDSLWDSPPRVPTVIVGLELARDVGDRRIELRTHAMFDAGVVEEVRAARAAHTFSHTAARIHGLQDVTAVLDEEIDRAEATRRLVLRTRQYAKRQRTWMRRIADVRLVDAAAEPALVAERVEQLL